MTTTDVFEANLDAMREVATDKLGQAGEGSPLPGQQWWAPAYSEERLDEPLRLHAVRGGGNLLSAPLFLRDAVATRIGIAPGTLKKQLLLEDARSDIAQKQRVSRFALTPAVVASGNPIMLEQLRWTTLFSPTPANFGSRQSRGTTAALGGES